MGDLAKHGRGWVHRACWNDWELRSQWAASAASLIASSERHLARDREVLCSSESDRAILFDTLLAIELRFAPNIVSSIISSNEVGGAVVLGEARWCFICVDANSMQVEAEMAGEVFERFELPMGRWSKVLRDAAGAAALGPPPRWDGKGFEPQ
jgi:hypothetical protein